MSREIHRTEGEKEELKETNAVDETKANADSDLCRMLPLGAAFPDMTVLKYGG